ncbi:hypothetical protein B7494_g6983 [Chlorociboria aeruginascens]|nr:hypothetical protein B7494_g6983 [Chlorociboria aeruginascens]
MLQAYNEEPIQSPREHTLHCLNILREAIVCDADDTPRYTGRLNDQAEEEHPTSGVGQVRTCKDWSKLVDWANKNSACFKAINYSNPDFPNIDRYKFCPDGRVLWPV